MNCKDFQKQFEVGSILNDPAKTHLDKCENCREFERTEMNLTQMIQSLPRVEAPKDFAFRLNSYIAKTEKVKRPLPVFWQTLRFALPLAAAVLIFGFVIFNSSLFTSENQNLQAINKENKPEIKENIKSNLPDSIAAETEKTDSENKVVQPIIETKKPNNNFTNKQTAEIKQTKKSNKTVNKIIKPVEEDFVGSENFASTQPPVLFPQNNSAANEATETEFVDKRKTLVEIGILTTDENWKVNAVKKESIAERSGVKIGDVITEINKIPVSAQIPQSENIEIKSLKVVRGKNIVNINLVN